MMSRPAAPLLLLALLLPLPTLAQSDDAAYCAKLGALASRYIVGGTAQGEGFPDRATSEAISDCNRGNTASGIKALEQKLHDNGFTLPKRS
jgi:hypothetical protein